MNPSHERRLAALRAESLASVRAAAVPVGAMLREAAPWALFAGAAIAGMALGARIAPRPRPAAPAPARRGSAWNTLFDLALTVIPMLVPGRPPPGPPPSIGRAPIT
jgi:hypothetical protein